MSNIWGKSLLNCWCTLVFDMDTHTHKKGLRQGRQVLLLLLPGVVGGLVALASVATLSNTCLAAVPIYLHHTLGYIVYRIYIYRILYCYC